jgi:hypothetical protein
VFGGEGLDSGVVFGVAAGYIERVVCGTVVPNYEFKIGIGLSENAFYGGFEIAFSVVDSHDNGYGSHGILDFRF